MSLYASGSIPMREGMPLEDYLDVSDMLAALARDPEKPNRVIHPSGWIEDMVAAEDDSSLAGLYSLI